MDIGGLQIDDCADIWYRHLRILLNISVVLPEDQDKSPLNLQYLKIDLMEFLMNSHGSHKVNPNDFGDPLTFPLLPP